MLCHTRLSRRDTGGTRRRAYQARDRSDIVPTGMSDATDVELLWPYIAVAQIYAFHQSIELGLSPDNPNKEGTVNRVVQGARLYAPVK